MKSIQVTSAIVCMLIALVHCGCFQEPVVPGPSLAVKKTNDGGHSSPDSLLPPSGQNAGTLQGKDHPSNGLFPWEANLLSVIPAGFPAFGALSRWPFGAFVEPGFSLTIAQTGLARVLKSFSSKYNPVAGDSAASFLEQSPVAFGIMGSPGSVARYILVFSNSDALDTLLKAYPQVPTDDKEIFRRNISPELSFYLHRFDDKTVIASDSEIVKGAIGRPKEYPSITTTPVFKKLRPLVSSTAQGYFCADFPALVSGKSAYPLARDIRYISPEGGLKEESRLFDSLAGGAFFFGTSKGSLQVQGKLLRPDGYVQDAPVSDSCSGPLIAGETVDGLLSLSIVPEKLLSGYKDWNPLLGDKYASMVRAVVDRAGGFLKAAGKDFKQDVLPLFGSEATLLMSWKIRYPQFAVLFSINDSKKCSELMSSVRDELGKAGYVFGSRKMGEYPVYFTREQSVSPEILEPSFVITREFLVIASGRRVLDSILVEPEKLEGTEALCSVSRMLRGRMSNVLYLSTGILERLSQSAKAGLERFSPAKHGQCNANMVSIGETGKTNLFCPSGGMYTIAGGQVSCSVHGTVDSPLDPGKNIRESIGTAEAVSKRYSAFCGASVTLKNGDIDFAINLMASE